MSSILDLAPHLQQRVQAELKFGEALVWVGQPTPSRFMKTGFALWVFFIPWTAFSLFWMAGASGFHLPTFDQPFSFFPLFGVPFLLIGLGGLSSPLWLRHKARSIIYAISNQRAFSIEGIKSITVKSYLPTDIENIARTEHPDGTGDLVFKLEYFENGDGKQVAKHGFFAIEAVKNVERLLENLKRSNFT